MEYRINVDFSAKIPAIDVDDVESVDEALEQIKDDIRLRLESYFDEVTDLDVKASDVIITGQAAEAKVTDIRLFEEELQDLVPEELTVKFDYSASPDRHYTFDPIELEVEDAVEDVLREMEGLEEATVAHVNYKITWTESGEPID